MSDLAEYARHIHEKRSPEKNRILTPVEYPSKHVSLYNIRAIICDIYGTLINYWKEGFDNTSAKESMLLTAFRDIADTFGMIKPLEHANPEEPPEKTLSDFYHGIISLRHDQAKSKGIDYPEILIEKVWELIIQILQRHAYVPPVTKNEKLSDLSRRIAWYYNFCVLGRQLYPGVVETLSVLKEKNIVIGMLSNAQFYTPIDLTLMIRDQSKGKFDDIAELFDDDLSFLSYEYLAAKPDKLLFRKLYDALYEYHILPEQTVYIGNDLSTDIEPANSIGMKTAFFTGDNRSAFINGEEDQIIPDITFNRWTDLPERISFHAKGNL